MLFFKKKKTAPVVEEPELALELLPYLLGRSNRRGSLLRKLLRRSSLRKIKRFLIGVIGGGAALSLLGKLTHDRRYRAAISRELEKQLEPFNKKLEELEKQNEELKRQNEQLRKQLR